MKSRSKQIALFSLMSLIWICPALAFSAPTHPTPALSSLRRVQVKGKEYYAMYRVCSLERSKALMNPQDAGRFRVSNNVSQYGHGFYLFTSEKDARTFIDCSRTGQAAMLVKEPKARVKDRSVVMEVLLPKERFEALNKSWVKPELDWASTADHARHGELKQLTHHSQVLYGAWADDPHFPTPEFKPLNGKLQLLIVKQHAQSVLEGAQFRVVSTQHISEKQRAVAQLKTPWTGGERARADGHDSLHHLLDRRGSEQGQTLVSYLSQRFPKIEQHFQSWSGTHEGYTVAEHTNRAFALLDDHLTRTDLSALKLSYPQINAERTLKMALLLHDIGKPVALAQARALLEEAHAQGQSFSTIDARQIKPHQEQSLHALAEVMGATGFSPAEVKLAQELVKSRTIGHLVQEKINFSMAREEIKQSAARCGVSARDFFQLQSLFYAADAGSYPALEKTVFNRDRTGNLVPVHPNFHIIAHQL